MEGAHAAWTVVECRRRAAAALLRIPPQPTASHRRCRGKRVCGVELTPGMLLFAAIAVRRGAVLPPPKGQTTTRNNGIEDGGGVAAMPDAPGRSHIRRQRRAADAKFVRRQPRLRAPCRGGMRHCQRSPPPPPLRSPPGSSQPQGGGASSFASGVTASVAAATDTALRRRQRRKRHTTLIGRRWGPPWGGCGRRRLRRPTNQWSVCRGRSAPQRLRQRRRHPSAPTPSPASGQPPRSTVMAATSTCGRAAVAFPQHPPLSPERVQRHRFQKAHGRHAASLPQSLLFVPPPRAADSPLVSNAANGAHLSWTGRRGRLPPAPLSPPLQEKSPGISRVLGPRNPGLMEEKPPLRRPSSALNIPALPGYTWMQGSPQASRGAIATRDP